MDPSYQCAYNEISFMVIWFLQQFSSTTLDKEAFSSESFPPAHWANGVGRKAIEKVYPKTHLTMYVNSGLWVRMNEAEKNA